MKSGREIKFIISTEAQNHFGRLLDDVAANGTRWPAPCRFTSRFSIGLAGSPAAVFGLTLGIWQ